MYITELSASMKTKTVHQAQGPQSRSLPRHFKLSTHNPCGAALTYYDISKDKLFVSKSIGILCQAPYVHAAKIFLENLYRYAIAFAFFWRKCSCIFSRCIPRKTHGSNVLSLESYVFNLLYEVSGNSSNYDSRLNKTFYCSFVL